MEGFNQIRVDILHRSQQWYPRANSWRLDASSDDDKDDCPDDDPVSPQSQFEIEDVIETLKKLTLFETDPKFDTLLSQVSVKINQPPLYPTSSLPHIHHHNVPY